MIDSVFRPFAMDRLPPRTQRSEEVFEALRRDIVTGRIQPLEWLRQEDLSNRLGVSQTPVREALDRLVASGLAERMPFKGVRVCGLSAEELVDAHLTRLLLEGPVVRAAARRMPAPEIEALWSIMREADELETSGAPVIDSLYERRRLNREFHLAIARSCGSAPLLRAYEVMLNLAPIWTQYEGFAEQGDVFQRYIEGESRDHRAIVAALVARDGELAARLAVDSVKRVIRDLTADSGVAASLVAARKRDILPGADLATFRDEP